MPLIRLDQLQQFAAINVLSDPGATGGPYIVPSCAQITLTWGMDNGRIGHNVLVGRYSGAFHGTTAEANSMLTTLTAGATWTALAGFIPTTVRFQSVAIRDVNAPEGALITSNTTGPLGTSASPGLPSEVAAVVTLRTAKAGRANRGRIYFGNLATNALGAGNVIAAAAVTALQNWAAAQIQAALSAQGYTLVIGKPARNAYTGSTGTSHPARQASSEPVTTLQVKDNTWDSQRRRGLK